MSGGKQLALADAQRAARGLARELEPFCERIEIAGSVRRGKPLVSDIELVAIPKVDRVEELDMFGQAVLVRKHNYLDAHLRDMLRAPAGPIFKSRTDLFQAVGLLPDGVPDVVRWGERYKRFYFLWPARSAVVSVDLFITTPDNFGAIYVIRTGPSDFSRELVTHLKHHTPYRQQDGAVIVEATGEVVPVREETDYFALAGVPYIEPERRNVPALRKALRETGA